jgi:hypothetical protein
MAELKTKPTKQSVKDFVDAIKDEQQRKDCRTVSRIMKRITKANPKMWGPGMVGFGSYHYKYASGREGDWFLTGFAPRKQNLTLYIMAGFKEYSALLKKLGKHKISKSCLYIKRLDDVDMDVLTQLIEESVAYVRKSNA